MRAVSAEAAGQGQPVSQDLTGSTQQCKIQAGISCGVVGYVFGEIINDLLNAGDLHKLSNGTPVSFDRDGNHSPGTGSNSSQSRGLEIHV